MNLRQLFLQHLAQTSDAPLALHIVRAEGCILTDDQGNEYLDLVGGISVANVGHRHPKVLEAIQDQLGKYLHIMVYGEMVQTPQVRYAELLCKHLPAHLDSVYFTNSGAEAVEGAMKLAKRVTGRTQVVAFDKSYHGSTQGALSIIGDEYWRNAFRPLLPGVDHLRYNSFDDLERICADTACVVVETVQAEAGIIVPVNGWLTALAARCRETGALLVLDEIQAGFGRTGKLWGFQHYDVEPDILLLGKALGGGMPLGAFIARREHMNQLASQPVLGHITTFGGHPVCCAAGLAAFELLLENDLAVTRKEQVFLKHLAEAGLENVRSAGLWMAVEFPDEKICRTVIDDCIAQHVFTDWFLFASHCMRISPPLTITEEQIAHACSVIARAVQKQARS
ncbi:MAG TPA: aspartate aminotransferase family protein [Flavisolibacter sp.]